MDGVSVLSETKRGTRERTVTVGPFPDKASPFDNQILHIGPKNITYKITTDIRGDN